MLRSRYEASKEKQSVHSHSISYRPNHLCKFIKPTQSWQGATILTLIFTDYHGKTILFHATERDKNISLEPDLGWEDYVTEGVEAIRVSGNHQNNVKWPHVQVLTE